MKNKILLYILLFICSTSCNKSEPEKAIDILLQEPIVSAEKVIKGTATEVKDGDTFLFEWTEITNGKSIKQSEWIRSYGIDAPELKQAYGNKSKEFLENYIFEKEISVYVKGKDNYNRILGIVYKEGKDINLETLKEGYAWHYKKYDDTPSYSEAEIKARSQKLGLWKDKKPKAPWKWRKENYKKH